MRMGNGPRKFTAMEEKPIGAMLEVLVVEDHDTFRAGLMKQLNATPGIRAWEARDAQEALAFIGRKVPDIVVMDIKLPGEDGIQCTSIIKDRWPQVQVMMCTVHEDDDKIFNALRAGASGYLLKRAAFQEILASIRMMQEGGSPMSPAIARRVVESFQRITDPDDPDELTSREHDVLDLMATGLRDKEIAVQLGITANTVRTHIRHIYEKLQVQGRVEAVRKRGPWAKR